MLTAVGHADIVYLLGVHTGMNLSGHLVEYAGIDDTCPADALNLFLVENQVARGHFLTFVFPIHHFPVEFRRFLSRQAMPSSFLIQHFSIF